MRTVDGSNDLSIPELRRSDLHNLSEKAWKAERIALLNTLDESNADPELRLKTLREHDANRGTIGPLLLYSYQIIGCDEIIATACDAAKVPADRFSQGLPDRERQRIARELMGFRPLGEASGGEGETT